MAPGVSASNGCGSRCYHHPRLTPVVTSTFQSPPDLTQLRSGIWVERSAHTALPASASYCPTHKTLQGKGHFPSGSRSHLENKRWQEPREQPH